MVQRIREDIAWREVDGEGVLVDTAGGNVLVLNRTGTLIWKWLDQGKTREEISVLLAREFDLSGTQAGKDVSEFLQTLSSRTLLEEVE